MASSMWLTKSSKRSVKPGWTLGIGTRRRVIPVVLGKRRGDLGLVADESGVEALRLDVVLNELVEDSTSERRAGSHTWRW